MQYQRQSYYSSNEQKREHFNKFEVVINHLTHILLKSGEKPLFEGCDNEKLYKMLQEPGDYIHSEQRCQYCNWLDKLIKIVTKIRNTIYNDYHYETDDGTYTVSLRTIISDITCTVEYLDDLDIYDKRILKLEEKLNENRQKVILTNETIEKANKYMEQVDIPKKY